MAQVFVSYSRKDIVFAKRLTAELQKSELDFWIDWEGIPPTVDWWKEIEKGIEEADIFLFLISPDSVKSKPCGQEIDTAVRNGKRIIPIVVRDNKWEDTPSQLRHLNYIFFRESDDFDASAKKLITAVHTDYEWAATHRRLQVKALDWERNNKDGGFLLRGADLLDAESDLAINTSKDPHPTDLQREFVFESRKAVDRQRRITTSIAAGGVVVLTVLAIIAVVMAVRATQQARIALARQLAAQAQFLNAEDDSKQMIASLLSIQSLDLYPTSGAAAFLLNQNLAAKTVFTVPSSYTGMVVFSPDGKHIASVEACGSGIHCIKMRETLTGHEVFPTIRDQSVSDLMFSSEGDRFFVLGCDQPEGHSCLEYSMRTYAAETGRQIDRFPISAEPNDTVSMSPDQKHIIINSCDPFFCIPDKLRILEVATEKEIISPLTQADEMITIVSLSPDGRYLVASDSTVWNVITGQRLFTIGDEMYGADAAGFSRDGNYVAFVGGEFHVWDVVEGKEVLRTSYDDGVYLMIDRFPSPFLSRDGSYVVLAGQVASTRVWDTASGQAGRIDLPSDRVSFSQDGRSFVSTNQGNVAIVRDSTTGQEIARMTHNSPISAVGISPDGQYAASAGGGEIRIWRVATGLSRLQLGGEAVYQGQEYISIVNCEQKDAGGCQAGSVSLWKTDTAQQADTIPFQGDVIAVSPAGYHLMLHRCEKAGSAGLCERSRLTVREILSGKTIIDRLFDVDARYSNFGFNSNGSYFLGRTDDTTLRIWDTNTGEELAHLTVGGEESFPQFSLSPDGNFLVSLTRTIFKLWDVKEGGEIMDMPIASSLGYTVFSPNSRYIVVVDADVVQVWDIHAKKKIGSLHTKNQMVAFSSDSRLIATVNGNNQIVVWDFIRNKDVATLPQTEESVSLAFDPNSQFLVATSDDVRVWDLTTEQEIARMTQGSRPRMYWSVFSADGGHVVSFGSNQGANINPVISFWEWRREDVIENACSYLTRNLNRAEWQQYIGNTVPYPKRQKDAPCAELPIDTSDSAAPMP